MLNLRNFAFASFLLLTLTISATPVSGQELTFSISVTTDAGSILPLVFGVNDYALPGLDEFDIPEPPPAPGSLLHAYLSMQSPPPGFPNRWHCDMRSLTEYWEKRVEIWDLTLETDLVGGTGSILIEAVNHPAVPYKLWVQGPGGLFQDVVPPCTVSFPVNAPVISFYWILEVDDLVDIQPETWGGVKSLFR